jgi:hypothetical protein
MLADECFVGVDPRRPARGNGVLDRQCAALARARRGSLPLPPEQRLCCKVHIRHIRVVYADFTVLDVETPVEGREGAWTPEAPVIALRPLVSSVENEEIQVRDFRYVRVENIVACGGERRLVVAVSDWPDRGFDTHDPDGVLLQRIARECGGRSGAPREDLPRPERLGWINILCLSQWRIGWGLVCAEYTAGPGTYTDDLAGNALTYGYFTPPVAPGWSGRWARMDVTEWGWPVFAWDLRGGADDV